MPTLRLTIRASALAAAIAWAGVAPVRAQPPSIGMQRIIEVGAFSRANAGDAMPAEWQPYVILPGKPRTRYALVNADGARALEARADNSASGLYRAIDADPRLHPWLAWRWRIDLPVAGANLREAGREDSPARVMVFFDGDRAKLTLGERTQLRVATMLSGTEMPYATLMYVWAEEPHGTLLPNPRTSRVQMIVVDGAMRSTGRWVELRRNLREDYRRAFREEPGPIIGVGILTDADNTNGTARSLYGDISLRAD